MFKFLKARPLDKPKPKTMAVPPQNAIKAAQEQKKFSKVLRERNVAQAELRKMRKMLAGLASDGWVSPSTSNFVDQLQMSEPSLANGIAFKMLHDEDTRELAFIALIRIQFRRRLYEYVMSLAAHLGQETILDTCYEAVVVSAAIAQSDRAITLIEGFLASENSANAPVQDWNASLRASTYIDDLDLTKRILNAAPPIDETDETSADAIFRVQIRDWSVRASDRALADARPHVGFLAYRSPLKPSTNIGDFVQSIAMMGLVTHSAPRPVAFGGDGADTLSKVSSMVKTNYADGDTIPAVWVDRDDPSTTPTGAPIWVPVNGWFMHGKLDAKYDFPFAPNIRPLFIGMHINQAEMLDDEAVAYLKKYQPIGARDYHTAEILMANGVEAFMSGCPTLSLDTIFGQAPAEGRKGKYLAAHRPSKTLGEGVVERIHMAPAMPTWGVDRGLDAAWDYLSGYSTATEVETPLLHCYLPCRALGTEVSFTHPRRQTDPRFEGLIGITEHRRKALVNAMKKKLKATLSLAFNGASDEEVYAEWRSQTAEGVERIRARMAEKSAALKLPEPGLGDWQSNINPISYKNGEALGAPVFADDRVELVFCFDQNFRAAAYATIRSVVTTTTADLRITVLTRGLSTEDVERLTEAFPEIEFVWLDVSEAKFGDLKLLKHTTVSTMDRLFLPLFITYAKRVAYLDVDIVVRSDIKELYDIDLGDHAIAARRTMYRGWDTGFGLANLTEKRLSVKNVGIFRREFLYTRPMNFGCFNAGVQVWDLTKLREANFTARLLQMVASYGINDQNACNFWAEGNFARIPPEWNHFATQEWIDDPKLIHYTGYVKPWHQEYCPRAEEWRQHVEAGDNLVVSSATERSWFR